MSAESVQAAAPQGKTQGVVSASKEKLQGIVICGFVFMKEHKPKSVSKEGNDIEESWRVTVGWNGGNAVIKVSSTLYDALSIRQDVRLPVFQKGFGNNVYNTAIEI